ncbi:hypothetical protein EK21DRAFT_108670 [Setomelanomma holmii]|uniref:Uncharacterized protein n=1 Tax=Setomelanomma holmii TaxID=210430 RepID=A0A9P4HFD4_9PLEO|nr:hypothetical protein EK21DRAFT_108670 [Setomelanomma holmii]
MLNRVKSIIYKPSTPTKHNSNHLHTNDIPTISQTPASSASPPTYPFPLNVNLVRKFRHECHPPSLPAPSDNAYKVQHVLFLLLTSRMNDCAKKYPEWVLETCMYWTGTGYELHNRTELQLMESCPISAVAFGVESTKHKQGVFAPPEARAMIGQVIAQFVKDKKAREVQADMVHQHWNAELRRESQFRHVASASQLAGYSRPVVHGNNAGLASNASQPVQQRPEQEASSYYGPKCSTSLPLSQSQIPLATHSQQSVRRSNRPKSCPPVSFQQPASRSSSSSLPPGIINSSMLAQWEHDHASSRESASTAKTSPPSSVDNQNKMPLPSSQIQRSTLHKELYDPAGVVGSRQNGNAASDIPPQRPTLNYTKGPSVQSSDTVNHAIGATNVATRNRCSSVGYTSSRRATVEDREQLQATFNTTSQARRLASATALDSHPSSAIQQAMFAKRSTYSIPESMYEDVTEDLAVKIHYKQHSRHDSAADDESQTTTAQSANFLSTDFKSWVKPYSNNVVQFAKSIARKSSFDLRGKHSSVLGRKSRTSVSPAVEAEAKDTSKPQPFRAVEDSLHHLRSAAEQPTIPSQQRYHEPKPLAAQRSTPHLRRRTEPLGIMARRRHSAAPLNSSSKNPYLPTPSPSPYPERTLLEEREARIQARSQNMPNTMGNEYLSPGHYPSTANRRASAALATPVIMQQTSETFRSELYHVDTSVRGWDFGSWRDV